MHPNDQSLQPRKCTRPCARCVATIREFRAGSQKTGRPKERLPERDIARAQKGAVRGRPSRRKRWEFTWVAERDLTFFYVDLCSRLLELQIHEEAMSPAAHGTTNEPGDRKKQPMAFELRGGPDDEVQDLMNLAIERPKQFCKALCAALLTPPKGWRARARRKGLWDDGTPSKRQPTPLT